MDGEPLVITVDNIRRVKASLLDRLWLVVLGVDPSDIDPQWGKEQEEEHQEALLEASEPLPVPIGQVKEERAAKNSETG